MMYYLFDKFELFVFLVQVAAIASSNCGQSWIEDPASGHCSQIVIERSTWQEARIKCMHRGGDLVCIEWPEEQSFLSNEIGKRSFSYEGLWIGATDLHSSLSRTWVNGKIINYTNWNSDQPDNADNKEQCAEIRPTWNSHWNDMVCDYARQGYICEKFSPCDALRPRSLRCQNGGTCHNAGTTYRCQCQPSFTGYDCGIDIDECQLSPCQQGASCNNTFGDYNCHCPSRYTGKDCTLDKCQMAKADVVFLVDSSQSQGPDRFKTQLDFIGEFVKSVYVGSDYVQIGLITFSFVAKVEFELTRYSRQSDLLDALQNIKYNAGSTNTAAALKMAREDVLSKSRPGVRKLAILLTDGMSSNKLDTMYQSALLRNSDVTIVGIGIGSEILHEELLKITANPNNVFTVSTFDGLYSILSNIRLLSCDVCSEKATDLLYLLDTSGRHSLSQFHGAIEALQSITSFIEIGISKVRVSLVTYASEPKRIFDFMTFTSENEIHQKIQVINRDSKSVANLTKALWYVSQKGFTASSGARNDSRQVIVLLTNGKNIDTDAMKHVNLLKGSGKSIVTIAYGNDIARETLLNVASEPYMFFHLGEELFTDVSVLSTMKTLSEFITCSLQTK